MPESTESEFQTLLQQAIDGALSPVEGERLQELARGNRDRLEQLVDHALITSLLIEEGGTESVTALVDFVAPDSPPSKQQWSWKPDWNSWRVPRKTAVAAGIIALAGMFAWALLNPAGEENYVESIDDSVAQLAQSVGVHWESENQPSVGVPLSPGILKFREGLVQIDFYSGAQVIVEGPAELELVSAYRAWCRNGRVRARVPQQARGFTILTPNFELVDLGTEFGMDVAATGEAQVQVFDGEVELHSSHQKQSLLGGQAVKFDRTGKSNLTEETDTTYPSFDEMEARARNRASAKLEAWKLWNQALKEDPRVVAHFDFETRKMENSAVVGCARAEGRWPGKGALEFRRSGDRVRVDVPGEFDALTMAAWIRLDAVPRRYQALLLTDQYKVGHVHWQIGGSGELRFGSRVDRREKRGVRGNSSPPLFDSRELGVWSFVCTTFDRHAGFVRHYLNGRQVSAHQIPSSIPMKIGPGDIGNWSVPLESPRTNPVRNFVGRMDEMTIWNTALAPAEIREIFRTHRP